MSYENKYDTEQKGLLAGVNELGPKKAKAALVGVVAVGALIMGGQKIAERLAAVANPSETTKTNVVNNARDPRAGYSQVTTTTSYTQQEIGGK